MANHRPSRRSLLPLIALAICSVTLLSACERSSSLEARALRRFHQYCAREKIACDKSMLSSVEYGWWSATFQFDITHDPDHFVMVVVYRNGPADMLHWNDRDH
jgi:hypothetical protein